MSELLQTTTKETKMFIVLARTDEYRAANAVYDAVEQATPNGDLGAPGPQAAYKTLEDTQEFRCRGVYETEAKARAAVRNDDTVAYLFRCARQENGKFVVYMGDNGWEFLDSTPGIVLGMFDTREQAGEWADLNGSKTNWVFELEPAAEAVAA
jgi:hypothetical protein